jgi:DNA end-binding protein Ku
MGLHAIALVLIDFKQEILMARPIWSGTLSFGLLNVPVSLMTGERRVDLHFRMIDARNNKPVRYERVNAETGDEVPWKDIVKAFEYDKGSYVVLKPEDIKSAAADRRESIDIEAFVNADEIEPQYFEKPYFLVPGKKAEKGYVLLRETLRKTKRLGIGRVVIRTREYICAVMPQGDALVMILLRYPQELVNADDYAFPSAGTAGARISPAELKMAEQLIESMSGTWKPGDFKDEFRERLTKVIQKRMKTKGIVKNLEVTKEEPEDATTNVVDFMSLLQKSLATNKRKPAAKRAVAKVVSKKVTAAKLPRKRA